MNRAVAADESITVATREVEVDAYKYLLSMFVLWCVLANYLPTLGLEFGNSFALRV